MFLMLHDKRIDKRDLKRFINICKNIKSCKIQNQNIEIRDKFPKII